MTLSHEKLLYIGLLHKDDQETCHSPGKSSKSYADQNWGLVLAVIVTLPFGQHFSPPVPTNFLSENTKRLISVSHSLKISQKPPLFACYLLRSWSKPHGIWSRNTSLTCPVISEKAWRRHEQMSVLMGEPSSGNRVLGQTDVRLPSNAAWPGRRALGGHLQTGCEEQHPWEVSFHMEIERQVALTPKKSLAEVERMRAPGITLGALSFSQKITSLTCTL